MPVRLVLDTNVALDLLLFDDPGVSPIARALADARASWITDAECRAEFERVLGYPKFALEAPSIAAALVRYDALTQPWMPSQAVSRGDIPHCRDPDDQKFLDLAYASGANYLISKDRSLLDLARKVHK